MSKQATKLPFELWPRAAVTRADRRLARFLTVGDVVELHVCDLKAAIDEELHAEITQVHEGGRYEGEVVSVPKMLSPASVRIGMPIRFLVAYVNRIVRFNDGADG